MIRKILSIILVLFWMVFIFYNSNEIGKISDNKTEKIIVNVVSKVSNVDKDDKSMKDIIKKIKVPLRKSAHFFEYFLLAILIMNMLLSFGLSKWNAFICSIVCLLYAISDEVHQLFTDGRSGCVSDVLLDSSAAFIATYLFNRFINMRIKYEKNT